MKEKEMLLEWYSWLLRSLHIIKSFSLSKRRDIEFAKGPRFDSAFEYTHARTFSFFFSPFFSIIIF